MMPMLNEERLGKWSEMIYTLTATNRGICVSLTLAQISPHDETSHIPRTLSDAWEVIS